MSSEVYATTYFGSFVGGYADGYAAGVDEDGWIGGGGNMGGGWDGDLPDIIFNNEVGAFEAVSSKCGGGEYGDGGDIEWRDMGFKVSKKKYIVKTEVYSGSREAVGMMYAMRRGGHDDDGDEIDDEMIIDEDELVTIGGDGDEIIIDEDERMTVGGDWDDFIAAEVMVPEEIIIPLLVTGSSIPFEDDLYA